MARYEVLTPLRGGKNKIIPAGKVIQGDPDHPETIEKLRFGAIKLVPGSENEPFEVDLDDDDTDETAAQRTAAILAAVRETIGPDGKRPTVKEVGDKAGFTVKAADIDTAMATIAAEKAATEAGGNSAGET